LTAIKIFVLLLALSNVGYFLWAHGIAQSQDLTPAPAASLKLASEVPESLRAAAGAAAVTGSELGSGQPSAAAIGSAGTRCVSVGPFRDVSEAAHAAGTLRAGGYDPRQRVVEGEVWAGIWVFVSLPADRLAADQLAAKLKAAGIDDALEMPGPADGSVLSLGLYSDQRRAEARVAQAQALGFRPGMADRKRNGNVYWIDIDLKPSEGALDPTDLQGEAGRINRLEVKPCPQTAPVPP
jgi:hypothetical protein